MISMRHRFHGYGGVKAVYEDGRTIRGPLMSLKYMARDKRRGYRAAVVVSRKVGRVVDLVGLIHSVDSRRLAERISRMASEAGREVEVLFQVNTSGEDAKQGFSPEDARVGIPELASLPGLRARGLMTMAPCTDDEMVLRRTFAG